ncbi:MAG: T9SS type A sorting domain-containing protein [Crocinitomicaceae bacterium]
MKQLSINKPCHENWNKFTPKPEGGFCSSCEKIVIDFTNKTNQEISEILKEKSGENLCGRIGVIQLESFNDSFVNWQNNTSNRGFQSRFLYALVLTFGLTLFTNINGSAQHILGKISYTEQISDTTAVPDTIINSTEIEEITGIEEVIMGDIEIAQPQQDSVTSDSISTHIAIDKCPKPKVDINLPKMEYPIIMGMMVLSEPEEVVKPNELKPPKPVLTSQSIGNIFPNPANTEATLFLDILQTEFYSISIYDQKGNLCQLVLKKIMAEGKHRININLTEFESGLYHISISSQSHQSTIQLIKN